MILGLDDSKFEILNHWAVLFLPGIATSAFMIFLILQSCAYKRTVSILKAKYNIYCIDMELKKIATVTLHI